MTKRFYRFDSACCTNEGKSIGVTCKCKRHELWFLPNEWQDHPHILRMIQQRFFEAEVSEKFARIFLAAHENEVCLLEKNEDLINI